MGIDNSLIRPYNMRVILNLKVILLKREYQTEQRKRLVSFLEKNSDKQYTIEEIAVQLGGSTGLGKSTIYRIMAKLSEDGIVRRFANGNSRQFLYQIVDCQKCAKHLHLKCVGCGKLIHLDEQMSCNMQDEIKKQHKFMIDDTQTMLFGKCEDCSD